MRIARLIIFSVVFFIVSFVIVKQEYVSYDYFIKTEFLFTFLGVFIGFAITLYTYITSMFEKMRDLIREKYKDEPLEIERRLKELPKLHAEIKDNIMYLFYALLLVVIISVGDKILIELNESWDEVKNIIEALLLTVFLLSILSLRDLIVTSFAISDFIIKGDNEKKD